MKKPEDYGIKNYEWKNGKLNVFQDVDLSNKKLKDLPFNFGIITGDFNCSINGLVTLKGSPLIIKGLFDCSWNKLKTLKGCPNVLSGLNCSHNNISSLECSLTIIGTFFFEKNPIKNIKNFPKCLDMVSDFSKEQIDKMIKVGINKDKIRLKMKQI